METDTAATRGDRIAEVSDDRHDAFDAAARRYAPPAGETLNRDPFIKVHSGSE